MIWRQTTNLRLGLRSSADRSPVLQQMFRNAQTGDVEWRDVPVVPLWLETPTTKETPHG